MSSRDVNIGIDLGTTNCALSFYISGRNMESVSLDNGYLLRSAVDWRSPEPCVVGKEALKRTLDLINGMVVLNAKRLIGRKFDTEETKSVMHSCRVKVVSDNQGYAAFSIPGTGHVIRPQDVSAKLLDHMFDKATVFLTDYKIKGVTVTVPASFDQDQRLATLNAVELSKFGTNVRLLSEPVAAAISHNLMHSVKTGYILVYDFGGGTFDVSIMEVQNETSFKVIATDGLGWIGGENYDMMIYDDMLRDFTESNDGETLIEHPHDRTREARLERYKARIIEMCREMKESLSAEGNTIETIDMGWLFEAQANDNQRKFGNEYDDYDGILMDYTYTLSRAHFESLIRESIDRTIQCTRSCLDKAGLQAGNINHVVLVGGSSRIPLVRKKLAEVFPIDRITCMDPDLCVSKGAAYYSAACDHLMEITFEECAPFSVFTKVRHGHRHFSYDPIITCRDMLPCTRSKRYIVDNAYAFEDEILIGKTDKDCRHLANIECCGITVKPNVVLVYTFTLTKEGILRYSVMEEETKKELVKDETVTDMNK